MSLQLAQAALDAAAHASASKAQELQEAGATILFSPFILFWLLLDDGIFNSAKTAAREKHAHDAAVLALTLLLHFACFYVFSGRSIACRRISSPSCSAGHPG